MAERPLVIIRTEPEGSLLTFKGRDAWAFLELIKAGDDGITPLDTPGPRWSGYVQHVRKAGLVIETIHEPLCGPCPGTHALYVLGSDVTGQSNQKETP
jgi:hypothetical protein